MRFLRLALISLLIALVAVAFAQDSAPAWTVNWLKVRDAAIVGVATAMVIDFQAFRSWKSFQQFREYDWTLAVWRWSQGAVIGAVGAIGGPFVARVLSV